MPPDTEFSSDSAALHSLSGYKFVFCFTCEVGLKGPGVASYLMPELPEVGGEEILSFIVASRSRARRSDAWGWEAASSGSAPTSRSRSVACSSSAPASKSWSVACSSLLSIVHYDYSSGHHISLSSRTTTADFILPQIPTAVFIIISITLNVFILVSQISTSSDLFKHVQSID